MQTTQPGFYPRVSLAFARLSDATLIVFVSNLLAKMAENSNFPKPTPALATVSTALDTFSKAVHDALDGGRILIATRKANRQSLLALLRDLASFVTGNCQGDVLILLTSGFDPIKTPAPVGVLTAPQNPRLSYTKKSGELLFRFKGNRNAGNYSIESALSAEGAWESRGLSTSTRVMLDGLVPGKSYWVRCAANGSAGSSEWSVPTTMMAV